MRHVPPLKERLLSLAYFGLIGTLVVASLGLAYTRYIESSIFALTVQTKDNLLNTALLSKVKLEATIAAKEAELKAKQSEVDAKKAELEKASNELVAKIKELDSAKKKITSQESQLSANAKELEKLRTRPPLFTFTVESSSLSNVEQKKEDVKQLVTAAYDTIVDVYSQPYLLSSVTISFVESFSNPNAGAEIVISNSNKGLSLTIKLKDFDKNSFNDVNAVIHEIVHSFHGLAILDPVAYEEGITVAATEVVMEKLIVQGKIPSFNPLYIRYSSNQYMNFSDTLPRSSSEFYGEKAASYYQIAGYGWYQIYKADPNFFKKFNEKLYEKKRNGEDITESLVKDLIKASTSAKIDGKTIDEWLGTKAFVLR